VLEGVTFGMNDALKIMHDMSIPISEVRASGGGARSDFWLRLQADIYNRPIVITNAREGAAYGAALLAGVGTRVWKSVEEACDACIRATSRTRPNTKRAKFYAKHFETYDKLYGDLKARFTEIATLPTI
jgi:xylulokinase